MIIINVIGGLGNQMFQYAASLALANKHCTDLKYDLSNFKGYNLHNGFELENVFNISASPATFYNMFNLLCISCSKDLRRLLRRSSFKNFRNSRHIVEPHHAYWPVFWSLPNNVYLDGYWQSEMYFSKIATKIRQEFTFKPEVNSLNQHAANQIEQSNSVSIHIRRGDYVSNPKNAFLGTCSLDYYLKAINYVNSQTNNPHFFIFSDDLEWVKSNFPIGINHTYVDFNKGFDSFNDMRLMSLCKHNIIANSSFSWWGAWLNANPNKIVIAPKQWFASGISEQDLVPLNWIKI